MNLIATLKRVFRPAGPDFPGSHPADWESVKGLPDSDFNVGPHRLSHIADAPLTDDTREEAIARAGDAMVAAYERGHTEDARHFLDIMEALIARRSPEQVRRMTIARGLV